MHITITASSAIGPTVSAEARDEEHGRFRPRCPMALQVALHGLLERLIYAPLMSNVQLEFVDTPVSISMRLA